MDRVKQGHSGPLRHQPDELFRSTAPYYARYRPGYPTEMFTYLVERFRLDGTQRILDLGCGTGQIAIPLAGHAAEVVAVDPEPAMVDEGRRLAAERSVHNIQWRRGDSYRLEALNLPTLDVVTMGASFHWMDRHAVLRILDRLVLPNGGVVVASGGTPGSGTPPPWDELIGAVRAKWLGPHRRAGSGTYTHPAERHEDVLRQSPFSHLATMGWTREISRDLDSLVCSQFSYSYSAPVLLGENMGAFEADLRRVLMESYPCGIFTETVRTEVIIATRP
jgi:ubiquinone/menaquinone biosynthesis C-methylase UbiE